MASARRAAIAACAEMGIDIGDMADAALGSRRRHIGDGC